jgi:hypothetical protein
MLHEITDGWNAAIVGRALSLHGHDRRRAIRHRPGGLRLRPCKFKKEVPRVVSPFFRSSFIGGLISQKICMLKGCYLHQAL